jgi:hypothetical protein
MAISPEVVVQYLDLDLAEQGFEKSDSFWPGMTIQQAAAVSIRRSIVSKWTLKNSSAADKAALEKFLTQNKKCEEWSLPLSDKTDTRTEMLINGFKTAVWDFWLRRGYPLVDHPEDFVSHGKIGPGSNIGANGGDFYTKFFSSPLTCTSESLYKWYRRYIANFPEWSNAENIRLQHFGGARVVSGNRLSFVPKNDKISRCICVEPTLNTYFQLGFAHHLERRLRERFGINLRDQQFKNRDLARLGSITDGLVTIDLSSASDSISLKMVRELFPADFVRWLEFMRSPTVEIPKVGTVALHMLSSMGNGYTFPLETMIFAAVVSACANFRGIPLGNAGTGNSWGVFGDDIICPVSLSRDVIHLLDVLGFTVNADKSFVEGPFRESCGSDFYLGTNIRGVYLKTLDTMPSRFSAINQLLRFQTNTGIVLRRLIDFLLTHVKRLFVPPWENKDAGIHCPRSLAPSTRCRDTLSYTYRCMRPHLPRIRIYDSYFVVPRGQKRRIYNLSGLLISLLQRSVNSGTIGFRSETNLYREKRCVAPNWDRTNRVKPGVYPMDLRTGPERDREDYGLDWGRWKSVVESYF